MKKTFLTILAAISMMSTWAIEDATVDVTLLSPNNRYSTVQLEQGALYTNEKNPTDIIANISNTTTAVNIYAIADYGNMSIMTTNDLFGTYLGITTNASAGNYTLSFTNVSGMQLYLVDHAENKIKAITDGGSYIFTVAASSVIEDRFEISRNIAITTNEDGWATFSHEYDLIPVDGQTLYKGAINGDVLALDPVDYVKACEGVIVYGAPSTTYYFTVGNGSASFEGNDLKATATYNTSMQNVFVLKGNAFLEYTGTGALAAYKAFIQLPQSGAGAPSRIRMVINGTQGVENVETETIKAEKFVENGVIYIRRGNEVYNLQGQIVK